MSDEPREGPRFRFLGPVELDDADGRRVEPSGALPKALLAVLALVPLHPGDPVGVDTIADELWGDAGPQHIRGALQTLVSRVRQLAGDDAIVLAGGGYRLGGADGAPRTDLALAERLFEAAADADDRAALGMLETAAGLWRGEPGLDLGGAPVAETLTARAAELRRRIRTARVGRLVAAGRGDAAIAELDVVLALDPLDETAVAARMDALAAAGRRTEAVAAFADYRRRLGDELGLSPAAALVERNARLLREADADADGRPAREASGPRVRLGLRAAPNPLIGRDADLAAVAALLDRSRCVTILGAGGLGKTRLAQAVAAASEAPGVVFVELASVRGGDDLDLALATGLGLREAATARLAERAARVDLGDRVTAALGERPTLLVLDNCEQIVDAAAHRAAELLAAVPGLTILATSRSPLAIGAEHVYALEPLTAGVDADGPAVRLFVERAEAARPGAVLDLAAVARLCERLDGLPLAIELAAARVRSLSVGEIEARLTDRFRLLSTGDRSAPERHRTLESVIGWSWALLPHAERRALARLSWFPDGFGLEAAQCLLGDADAVELLDGLILQSLLGIAEHPQSGEPRYRMLETVREFGQARLAEHGETEEVLAAMADWATRFVRARMPLSGLGNQLEGFRALDVEHDTLVAVLRQALERRDAPTVAALAAVLFRVWTVRGAHSEVVAFLPPLVGALSGRTLREVPAEAGMVALALGAGTGLAVADPSSMRGLAMLRVLTRRGEPVEPWIQAVAGVLTAGDDVPLALRRLSAMTASDDPATAQLGFLVSSTLAENEGDADASERAARRGWELAQESGDVWSASMAAGILAQFAGQAGDARHALSWAARARAGFLALGADSDLMQLDWTVACALLADGRTGEAHERFVAMLADDHTTPDGLAVRQFGLLGESELARLEGRGDDADALVHELLEAFGAADGRRSSPWYLLSLATIVSASEREGRLQASTAGWAETLRRHILALDRMRPGPSDLPVLGAVLLGYSAWASRHGDADAALELLALATTMHPRQDLPGLRVDRHLADARMLRGDAAVDAALDAVAGLDAGTRAARARALLSAASPLRRRRPEAAAPR